MVTKFSHLTDKELEQKLEDRLAFVRSNIAKDVDKQEEFQLYVEVLNRMPKWIKYDY